MINSNQNINQDLDPLKSIWQSQKDEKTYDSKAIFKMIHRKSINSVQWLFIITIIEFLMGISLSLWTLFSGKHFLSGENISLVGEADYSKLENLSHLGIVGSIALLTITYYYYRKISSALAVQQLIQNIIRFRQFVIGFIIFWTIIVFIIFIPIMIDLGMNTFLSQYEDYGLTLEEAKQSGKMVGYITAGFTIFFILVFSALYYGFIYGIFLRRLGKNLKELNSIDK